MHDTATPLRVVEGVEPKILSITLVHGTWGRGAMPFFSDLLFELNETIFWFQSGSEFRARLESSLLAEGAQFVVDEFQWSGSNSLIARAETSVSLRKALDKKLEKTSNSIEILIAHSHGGTIVSQAMDGLNTRGRVFVVTLATPFVEIHYSGELEESVGLDISSGFGIIAIIYFFVPTRYLQWAASVQDRIGAKAGTFIVLALFGICVTGFMAFVGVGNKKKALRLEEASRCGMDWNSGPPLLVIRTVEDEASLVLAAGSIGNRISIIFTKTLSAILGSYIKYAAIVAFVIVGATGVFLPFSEKIDFVTVAKFGGVLLALCPTSLMLAGLFKSVYGRELLFGTLNCEIYNGSVPDVDDSSLEVVSLQRSKKGGLRHAIYNNDDCVRQIVKWLAKRGAFRFAEAKEV